MLFSRLVPLIPASARFFHEAHATPLNVALHARSSTSIGIIFDSALNWAFVSATPASQVQILTQMPVIIANAVDITTADVQSTSLGPQGTSTVFHAQISSNVADLLEIQIADRSSPFYNGPDVALASHVAGEV
ncbi:hypothetical protein DFH09DRAFT_1345228 [Mycena vulgaris]|nr:hypothetical protein DFH09DRAFT_1345228 [Mycena vulgaris]